MHYLVLITKIKAIEICCFVPKEQIPKYTFSMHWKCFHASNYTEEVINVNFISEEPRKDKEAAGNRNSSCTPLISFF